MTSRLHRRLRAAVARQCYPLQWPDRTDWDVYVEGEWTPRNLRLTYRAAIGLAYRISIAKRLKLTISYEPRYLMPWNDEHPCFVGDFDSPSPFDHDFRYEDTSQGDEIYFQQSGHMECRNCGHCEAADGFYGDEF